MGAVKWWVGVAVVLVALKILTAIVTVEAHHNYNGQLPYIPNTPAIQKWLATGELAFCFNSSARNYPQFVAQTYEVNQSYVEKLAPRVSVGLRFREIAGTFETDLAASQAGCDIYHRMIANHQCDGCAAWVMYANRPATIEYKIQLGFISWRSTIGHETGHIFGMHEGYDDVRFVSHILTYGVWASPWNAETVMDFGTHLIVSPYGVYRLTSADVRVICQWISCLPEPPPPNVCDGPYDSYGNKWDNCLGRWIRPNGNMYDPVTGNEYLPDGSLEWLGCTALAHRWNVYASNLTNGNLAYFEVGDAFYAVNRGWWSVAPPC